MANNSIKNNGINSNNIPPKNLISQECLHSVFSVVAPKIEKKFSVNLPPLCADLLSAERKIYLKEYENIMKNNLNFQTELANIYENAEINTDNLPFRDRRQDRQILSAIVFAGILEKKYPRLPQFSTTVRSIYIDSIPRRLSGKFSSNSLKDKFYSENKARVIAELNKLMPGWDAVKSSFW
jgi:hypothetical protein